MMELEVRYQLMSPIWEDWSQKLEKRSNQKMYP